MKIIRTFKASWGVPALVGAIVIGEVAAWELSNVYGFRSNPILGVLLSIGIIVGLGLVLYEGPDAH